MMRGTTGRQLVYLTLGVFFVFPGEGRETDCYTEQALFDQMGILKLEA